MTDGRASGPEGRAGSAVGRWWHLPDQFDWLTAYLRARGLAWPTKVLMALVSGALVLMAVATLPIREVPFVLRAVFGGLAVVGGLGYAALWLRGWPTRRQSLVMAVYGGVVIAVGCLMQPRPMLALMGCAAIALLGGYAAFFHNTKAIAVNVALGLGAGLVCGARVAADDGWVAAIAGLWLLIELLLAVPLAIQAVVRTLGADVVRSDQDPLTGVLNRRAFYERASTLLTSPGSDLHLIVVMIDLDKFKKLNDAYGHLAGDQALTAVGWALRESSDTAIIGRFGGEEFIVINAVAADVAERLPQELCEAIAALPHPVTASVGAAIVRWGCGPSIEELIRQADAAMYEAKRDGGNRSRICWPVSAER